MSITVNKKDQRVVVSNVNGVEAKFSGGMTLANPIHAHTDKVWIDLYMMKGGPQLEFIYRGQQPSYGEIPSISARFPDNDEGQMVAFLKDLRDALTAVLEIEEAQ